MRMTMPPVPIGCPCGVVIDVPIECELTTPDPVGRQQRLSFHPDYADLWAHAWTHDQTVDLDFPEEP